MIELIELGLEASIAFLKVSIFCFVEIGIVIAWKGNL